MSHVVMRIPHKAHALSSPQAPVGRKVQRRRVGIPKAVGADAARTSQRAKIAPPGDREELKGWLRLAGLEKGCGRWLVGALGEELVA